jgi:hypothetical protein
MFALANASVAVSVFNMVLALATPFRYSKARHALAAAI